MTGPIATDNEDQSSESTSVELNVYFDTFDFLHLFVFNSTTLVYEAKQHILNFLSEQEDIDPKEVFIKLYFSKRVLKSEIRKKISTATTLVSVLASSSRS